MKVIYQLWGLISKEQDWDTLIRKIDRLQDRRPAQALVCGVGAPEDVYRRIRRIADRKGSRMYLWLPVFSEWDDLADLDPLIDHHGDTFLKDRQLKDGFRFRCPQSRKNRDVFFEESLKHLKKGAFDGVFLDRIRFPSFQFGLSGVLSCFCPACLKKMRTAGLDPDRFKAACAALSERVHRGEDDPLGLKSFDGSRWELEDKDLQALFDLRCGIITDAVRDLGSRYREKGYRIGLDLFTPSLSYFAGQDIRCLAPLADFIKPMLYLHTLAPAGLPYELDVMNNTLQGNIEKQLLDLRRADSIESFAAQDIRSIKATIPAADVYCGMEVNRVREIAPVGPDEIRYTLKVFSRAGAVGVMPSWSFLSAPEENVSALPDGLE
ncbi:MAG: hypothetical protein IJR97_04670 [Clostridia bacterium]|nr:hypothetical protein [Clostridia bacterium]